MKKRDLKQYMGGLIICVLLTLVYSCGNTKQKQADGQDTAEQQAAGQVVDEQQTVETVTQPSVSEAEIKEIISQACINLFEQELKVGYTGINEYLTPELGELIQKAKKYEEEMGEIVFEADPFINAQDYPDNISPKVLLVEIVSENEANVEVELWNDPSWGKQVTKLLLKQIDGKWLVDDVSGIKENLRSIVK